MHEPFLWSAKFALHGIPIICHDFIRHGIPAVDPWLSFSLRPVWCFFFYGSSGSQSSLATNQEECVLFNLHLGCLSSRSTLGTPSPRSVAKGAGTRVWSSNDFFTSKTSRFQIFFVFSFQDRLLFLELWCNNHMLLINQFFTVCNDLCWPCNFPDFKYRLEGWTVVSKSAYTLPSSARIDFPKRTKMSRIKRGAHGGPYEKIVCGSTINFTFLGSELYRTEQLRCNMRKFFSIPPSVLSHFSRWSNKLSFLHSLGNRIYYTW